MLKKNIVHIAKDIKSKEMAIMQTGDKGGFVMNATNRFAGREKLTNTEKKRSGLIDGLLKDTLSANCLNKVVIAQPNYTESLTIGSNILQKIIDYFWKKLET